MLPKVLYSWKDIILTALAPAIWGSTYIVTSELLPADRPFTSALIRVLPAGFLLLLFNPFIPIKKDLWRLFVLGTLNIGIFQALLFIAAYHLPGGLAAVISAIQPLLVVVLVWVMNGRSPLFSTLCAAIAGICGMAILLLSPQTVIEPIGVIAALMGAVSMACGIWLTSQWKLNLPLLAMTGWQLVIGGIILAPIAYFFDEPLPPLEPLQYASYIYLSLAGALLAYTLWFRGLERLPTVAVASLGLLSPLTAVVLGWCLLSQSISGTALLGLIIVLISVFTVQWTTLKNK
jgi:probable blue pigment (indigoidine) exporter